MVTFWLISTSVCHSVCLFCSFFSKFGRNCELYNKTNKKDKCSPSLSMCDFLALSCLSDMQCSHWWSICGLALEILDEVQQSYPVDPLEDYCNLRKIHI